MTLSDMMCVSGDVFRYVTNFLVGEDCYNRHDGISYGCGDASTSDVRLVVEPSGAVICKNGKIYISSPNGNVEYWGKIPVLFGRPEVSRRDNKTIVYIDVFATVLYFAARQEEIEEEAPRDKYGRIVGKESYLARHGLLCVPVLDRCSDFLRELMGLPLLDGKSKINLTHDIDVPWCPFTFFGALKSTLGSWKRWDPHVYYLLNYFQVPYADPAYTFPEIIAMDNEASENIHGLVSSLYFVKTGGRHEPEDSKIYFGTKAFSKLMKELGNSGAKFGLHVSLEAGLNPELVCTEAEKLSEYLGYRITQSRNHYLASIHPNDFRELERCGITDDYTMGYADTVGFRLGTSRPLAWIDLERNRVSGVIMHPLTIMEGSLFGSAYMNLSLEEAWLCSKTVLDESISYGGEVNLLWHNASFDKGREEKALYRKITGYLSNVYS